ncbi:hypothetical protein DL764_007739 [Monosporascus ibericus]|uniref:Uncharacterized protein n=1 Tax=Monosporascus ibericus TaxID=155417 RepID=A0A4Q4T2D3_9PEZI|nr:hypothetical protein DL764_007739 [Monosporascus ibericus]
MSTPKRRSARLASAQRSIDSPAPQLGSIVERDEPAEEEKQVQMKKKKQETVPHSPRPNPSTPSTATPVKLPMSEMHPSKVHPSMAPPSSGLEFGFVDINPDQRSKDLPSGITQSTPSKTPLPSTSFTFRPDNELELGPEAREMMHTLREQTDRLKAELSAKRDKERLEAELEGRRIAQAKGKASRFSAAHMAEFKKMDSIENHPSLRRTNPERFTPLKAGIKRSKSKAALDEPDSTRSMATSARSTSKGTGKQGNEQESPIKRVRQRMEDDASALRPSSRDGSAIPRPKSSGNDSTHRGLPRSQTHASLATPDKAALAPANSVKTPAIALVNSPSKPSTPNVDDSPSKPSKLDFSRLVRYQSSKGIGRLTKSRTMNDLLGTRSAPTHVQTPGRFDKVKSILKRQFTGTQPKSEIPRPPASVAKAPAAPITDKELPPFPLTTPGRKLSKRVDFTPQTQLAPATQNSPTPMKSGIPHSKSVSKIPTMHTKSSDKAADDKKKGGEVSYPDLSAYTKDLDEETEKSPPKPLPPSVPGTFTFRSDHTIQFDSPPAKGFGGAEGQASLRHVRSSNLFGDRMPGSFPHLPEVPKSAKSKENKENTDPQATPTRRLDSKTLGVNSHIMGIPHGMSNKKRHRATPDDEDSDEGAQRGAKKSKKDMTASAPEGDALVAPRLVNKSSPFKKPGPISHTPSPIKKKGRGLTLSRLNMLAAPKVRNHLSRQRWERMQKIESPYRVRTSASLVLQSDGARGYSDEGDRGGTRDTDPGPSTTYQRQQEPEPESEPGHRPGSFLEGVLRISERNLLKGHDDEDKDGVMGVGCGPTPPLTQGLSAFAMVCSPAPRRLYHLEWKLLQKKTTRGLPKMERGAPPSASMTIEPSMQSSPASREEQPPASESSDSSIFISAKEYATPETASPADSPNAPDEPNTPNEPHHVMLPGRANDNQTGRRTPMPENHASMTLTPPPPKQGAGGSTLCDTTTKSQSQPQHTSKSLRGTRRLPQQSDHRTTPSAGNGTSGSATRVNGGARGGSLNYASADTHGEEVFPAAAVALPRGGVENRAWDDEKPAERERVGSRRMVLVRRRGSDAAARSGMMGLRGVVGWG